MNFVAFLALFSMLLLSISSLVVCQGAVTPLSFQQATGSSPWTGRALAFSTVVYVPLDLGFISVPLIAGGAESIGLIYGDSGATRYASDVWVAMDSLGATWTQKSATAPWSGRSVGGLINVVTNPSNPVMGAQILVLIGGRNSTGLLNDVWSSTNLGSSWQLLNSSLQTVFSPREQFGLVIAPGFDNSSTVYAYLIGGYGIGDGGGVVSLNDVYFTRGMGTMPWLRLTSKAGVPWSPRSAFSIASDNLQIVIAGGILDSGAPTNDVWILGLFSDLIWIRSTPALPASGWNALINTGAPRYGLYYSSQEPTSQMFLSTSLCCLSRTPRFLYLPPIPLGSSTWQSSVLVPFHPSSLWEASQAFSDGASQNDVWTAEPQTRLPQVGNLCFIFYSEPGDIDYPWSAATSVQFFYNAVPQFTDSGALAVYILSGNGTRTYTNKFGASFVTPLTVAPANSPYNDNLLYLNSSYAVDSLGLTWSFASSIQLPGGDPNAPVSSLNVYYNDSGFVVEAGSYQIDTMGSAFLSNVPGFVNLTIGAGDSNVLAVAYAACEAPILYFNGLQSPIEGGSARSGSPFQYSYFISDGTSYSVSVNLTLTAFSPFPIAVDELGNQYQAIIGAAGNRTYTYWDTGATVVSSVTGITSIGYSDQRFYPYALLASSSGIYTSNTAPFLDADGLGLAISPSAPLNGAAPGTGTQLSAINVFLFDAEQDIEPYLTEAGSSAAPPSVSLQEQYYVI